MKTKMGHFLRNNVKIITIIIEKIERKQIRKYQNETNRAGH